MTDRPRSAEINPGPGFRIRRRIVRPHADIIAQLAKFDTGDLSDLLNRLYAMDAQIHNMTNDEKIAGVACTVRVYPGDNLMVHKALDVAQPGDVIVIDANGNTATAVLGDMLVTKAQHRGIAGFIVDGLVRDLEAMREVGLPVFARGVTPAGPLHRGPGEINFPASCGGVVVQPGDVVVGDTTGVVVIPGAACHDTLSRAQQQRDFLKDYIAKVKGGLVANDWVDFTLNENGCLEED